MVRNRNDVFSSLWLDVLLCHSLTEKTHLSLADGAGSTSQQPNLHPAMRISPGRQEGTGKEAKAAGD